MPESKSIVSFGPESNSLIVVGGEGTYYKTDFSKGGICETTDHSKLLTTADGGDETV